MKQFLVVVAKTGREFEAEEQIVELFGERAQVVLPFVVAKRKVRHVRGQRLVEVKVPLFLNYFFARLQCVDDWVQMRQCKAVSGVLARHERPLLVAEASINRALEKAAEVPPERLESLPVGARVAVNYGPLISEGVHLGNGTVEVDAFGRRVRMRVPLQFLELIQ